ncbi:unnamed protein product [Phytophthora lilii]|uniref:Unnamed protein product n=1 Tax=Phytophthora lilii TaxID=2077276 RepID=A0A9W6TCW2_9STRA|nr:unnamed protein product [Phytophthora lilii]
MEQNQKRTYRKAGPFHMEFHGLQACLRSDKSQRDFMKYCLNKCKITSRGFESAYNQLLDGLVKRLKMLEGAKNIGDDSPLIKTEMKSILDKLYEKGVFSTSYYSLI